MSEVHVITGFIVRRRSIGRNLAFAEVDITETSKEKLSLIDSNSTKRIKVKFNRQSFLGSSSSDGKEDDLPVGICRLDDLFPAKKSSLPYGAKAKLSLGNCIKQSHSDGTDTSVDTCMWEVLRWKIIEHPKDIAEELASLSTIGRSVKNDPPGIVVGNGALSCSTYLKIRRQQYDKVNCNNKCAIHETTQYTQKPKKAELAILAAEYCHGGKHAKAKRAKIFAAWVLETFCRKHIPSMTEGICKVCTPNNQKRIDLTDYNQSLHNIHVLDIAGGKGHLSLELVLQQAASGKNDGDAIIYPYITNCTIIDPMVRKGDSKMRQSKLHKVAGQAPTPAITHIATCFTSNSLRSIFKDSFQSSNTHALLLGLHPDQCTEDIVDAALQSNESFAIVPCCVYPDLFQCRTYCEDKEHLPVRSYEDFLKYLMQKDKDIQMTTLPFDGRNIVLYKKVAHK